jgi:hypothetical protein
LVGHQPTAQSGTIGTRDAFVTISAAAHRRLAEFETKRRETRR